MMRNGQYYNTKAGLRFRMETVLTNPSISGGSVPGAAAQKGYERAVSHAYYNLDVSNMRGFLLKYVVAKLPDKSDESAMAKIAEITEIFREDHAKYRILFRKAISKQVLSNSELLHISYRLNVNRIVPRVVQVGGILRLVRPEVTEAMYSSGVLRAVYYFLLRLSTSALELERCTFKGCENVFTSHPGGHSQKYCSDSCKVKAYGKRQAAKQRGKILDSCGDNNGDLLRIGRKGSRYFLDKIGEAHGPKPGRVTRTFMKKAVAEKEFARFCS